MTQLVTKPGPSVSFDAVARYLQLHGHEFAAVVIAVSDRVRGRLPARGDSAPRREPPYFEAARMAREMYRL